MEGILKLVGVAVFVGLLAAGSNGAVPIPKSEWDERSKKY